MGPRKSSVEANNGNVSQLLKDARPLLQYFLLRNPSMIDETPDIEDPTRRETVFSFHHTCGDGSLI